MTTTGTALVPIETLTPAIFATRESADDVLAKLRAASAAQVNGYDISTDEGRKAIASAAYAVARTKTAIDKMGQELVAETKRKVKAFDAERARIWDGCEAIQSEVRKPLTEWEESEKARIAAHDARITEIIRLAAFVGTTPGTQEITDRLAALLAIANAEYDWQEFRDRAARSAKDTRATLEKLFAEAGAREAAAADAERKRQEAAAEAQRQREARIASEAAAKAKAEAEAAAEAEQRRIKAAADAEQRRLQAEADASKRRAAEEAAARQRAETAKRRAEIEAALAAEVAEKARIATAAKAEADKKAAIEAEQKRIAAEKQREVEAAHRREENQRHRDRVKVDAVGPLTKLIDVNYATISANVIFDAIAAGKIPHLKVEW